MKKIIYLPLLVVCFGIPLLHLSAQSFSKTRQLLQETYNLTPQHSKDTQYYEMISRLQPHALDGTPQGWDTYHLFLRCVPSSDPAKGDEYTCLKFTVEINKMPEAAIPALAGWKYYFLLTANAMDQKGQLFGIDHNKFQDLVDEKGNKILAGNAYHVYNAFIDFHSMSIFSEKTAWGNGAQDLRKIGDKVIHMASNSQAPVNLGKLVAEGSYFKNGQVTLLFKGLGFVNENTCALLEYDSGESSFSMLMKPMPNVEVTTKGSSHYWGDIYKDLAKGWIQKATLHEMVVSEINVPGASKINTVVERSIEIKNIKQPGL